MMIEVLREARAAICRHNLHGAVRIIDAALTAASGEARGDAVFVDPDKQEWPTPDDLGPFAGYCCENGNFGDGHTCMKQPAPSEAPNVERARNLLSTAIKKSTIAYENQLAQLRARIAELEKERDSARAEGIAAERERIAKWFESMWREESGPDYGLAGEDRRAAWRDHNRLTAAYADAIRNYKP